MSKFQELCDALKAASNKEEAERAAVYKFVGWLFLGFRSYLGAHDAALRMVPPPPAKPEDGERYFPAGAAEWKKDHWSFYWHLLLEFAPNSTPKHVLAFEWIIRQVGPNAFQVAAWEGDIVHDIENDADDKNKAREGFYEYLFEHLKNRYNK